MSSSHSSASLNAGDDTITFTWQDRQILVLPIGLDLDYVREQ